MLTNGNDAFLAAFTKGPDKADFAVDVTPVESDQFTDPKAGTVKDLQNRPVTKSPVGIGLRLVEETHHFLNRQEVWQRAGNLWGIQLKKRTASLKAVLSLQESEVTPDRSQLSGDGRAGITALTEVGEPAANFFRTGLHQVREVFDFKKVLELLQILAIGTQGLWAQISFRLKVLEEGFHVLHQSSQPEGISLRQIV